MKEIWKLINGYGNRYKISNLGKVVSVNYNGTHKEKEIAKHYREGYVRVTLHIEGIKTKSFSLHRLLAEYFIPNPDNKTVVNHKNGIRWDNRLENLEWCTQSENMFHATQKLGRMVKEIHCYNLNGSYMTKFYSACEAARMVNGSDSHILDCCHGKRKSHKGFMWSFNKQNKMIYNSSHTTGVSLKIFDYAGKQINEFNSILEASKKLNINRRTITNFIKSGELYKNSFVFKAA